MNERFSRKVRIMVWWACVLLGFAGLALALVSFDWWLFLIAPAVLVALIWPRILEP